MKLKIRSKLQKKLLDSGQLKVDPSEVEVEDAEKEPQDLNKLLKKELLAMSDELNLTGISSKNTKAQIIAAIQSAN